MALLVNQLERLDLSAVELSTDPLEGKSAGTCWHFSDKRLERYTQWNLVQGNMFSEEQNEFFERTGRKLKKKTQLFQDVVVVGPF